MSGVHRIPLWPLLYSSSSTATELMDMLFLRADGVLGSKSLALAASG